MANRLIREKSPYLLQHAHNPVDWHPWGEEAFALARREDKPVFLSIGYSTCYWCHVMEREVFENAVIAERLNQTAISIKVDREERPDIDHIYMSFLQASTGSGGWPMSVFLTPDRLPFFAATYIPPVSQHGRLGFSELLDRIREIWTKERPKVLEGGARALAFLKAALPAGTAETSLGDDVYDACFNSFRQAFDVRFGGFGVAPKFPRPVVLNFLFRYFFRTGNPEARDMALTTLRAMAKGGMYDQIGGGFHRYSTDAHWHVPHFEKMLYDQAQLAISYLEAFQITHDSFYADVAREILSYLLRDMTDERGGFRSAEDAESRVADEGGEQREGAFYVWSAREVREALEKEDADLAAYVFDVRTEGNVADDPRREFEGENILHVTHSPQEAAERFDMSVDAVNERMARIRKTLREVRQRRPRPYIDDKILVSWNGLAISAFARAFQVLGDRTCRDAALAAAQFIVGTMTDPEGRALMRRYRDGEAKFDGLLADYAFLVQGFLDLYEAVADEVWLQHAIRLTDEQIVRFHDKDRGGFFDTSDSDATLLLRTKESHDGAEPSGNAIAILNLLRLASMLNIPGYRKAAEQSVSCFAASMVSAPHSMVQFLVAAEFASAKPLQIVLAGRTSFGELTAAVHTQFLPMKVLLFAGDGASRQFLETCVPFYQQLVTADGSPTAYVCEEFLCRLPTSDPGVLLKLLEQEGRRKRK